MERSLRGAALWDEAKDKLMQSGLSLSGGLQQRLCIARAIALEPEARVSAYTARLMLADRQRRGGGVIETGETETIFTRPLDRRPENYVTGRFG